jgi:hypothetical protein
LRSCVDSLPGGSGRALGVWLVPLLVSSVD